MGLLTAKWTARLSLVVTPLILAACGGGGGGDSSASTSGSTTQNSGSASNPDVAGLYLGTTSTGRTVEGIVLSNGDYYVLYSPVGVSSLIAGAVVGSGNASNGSFASTSANDLNLEGLGDVPVQVSASYTPRQSIKGSISYPALNSQAVTFSAAYSVDYEKTPSVATIAGTYSGSAGSPSGIESGSLAVSASGSVTGRGSSGCTFTGSVTPHSSGNVYDTRITFGGAPCRLSNTTISGVAYFDSTTQRLYAVETNPSRTDGFVFAGTKQVGGAAQVSSGPLVISAKLNGQPISFSITAGESKVLGVLPGQEIELDASVPAILVTKSFGAAQVNETVNSPTQYKATINSTNATIGKLAFNTSSSAALATVTLAIQGSSTSFNPATPVVGDSFTYSEVDKQLGSAQSFTQPLSTHVVTALNSNGWTEAYRDPSGATYQTVQLNSSGNRLSYVAPTADPSTGCTNVTFVNEEKLLTFPLTPNSSYSGQWQTVCGPVNSPTNSQTETFTAQAKGLVQIATPGGYFNALQIDTTTVVTNSTQTTLPGRTYQQTVTEYFDPVLGRNVRYTGKRTYPAGNPTSGVWLTDVQIDLVSAVKN